MVQKSAWQKYPRPQLKRDGYMILNGEWELNGKPVQDRKIVFWEHTRDTITHLYNHPCIVAYTIFNEGWGQFDSEHIYFRAENLQPKIRPMFLSECGGFSLAVEGHRFNTEKSYGYGACKSKEELTERITAMYRKMVLPAIEKGLCGCVYTQLSDVEDEINGLYTYDREICKVVPEKFVELAKEMDQKIR